MKQRELKFRVWRNADKRFIQISGYKLQGGKLYPWEWRFDQTPAYHYIYTLEDVVIMQFTGLVDKNGDEIYEGDVVDVTNKAYLNGKKVVVWDDILLCYVLVWLDLYDKWEGTQGGTSYLKVSTGIKCTIIGNLYETPDLLTPKPNP